VIPVRSEGSDCDLKSAVRSLLYYRMPKKLQAEKLQQQEVEGKKVGI